MASRFEWPFFAMEFQTVWWEAGKVCLIDQTKLPHRQEIVRCASVADVVDAIRSMVVRGAPAIGVTAAYGIALAAHTSAAHDTLSTSPSRSPHPAATYTAADRRAGISAARRCTCSGDGITR